LSDKTEACPGDHERQSADYLTDINTEIDIMVRQQLASRAQTDIMVPSHVDTYTRGHTVDM